MPACQLQANSSWVAGGRSGSDSDSFALSCSLFRYQSYQSEKPSPIATSQKRRSSRSNDSRYQSGHASLLLRKTSVHDGLSISSINVNESLPQCSQTRPETHSDASPRYSDSGDSIDFTSKSISLSIPIPAAPRATDSAQRGENATGHASGKLARMPTRISRTDATTAAGSRRSVYASASRITHTQFLSVAM